MLPDRLAAFGVAGPAIRRLIADGRIDVGDRTVTPPTPVTATSYFLVAASNAVPRTMSSTLYGAAPPPR